MIEEKLSGRLRVEETNRISLNNEVLILDKDGFVYKGERIQDAGKAHKIFLEVMQEMNNE